MKNLFILISLFLTWSTAIAETPHGWQEVEKAIGRKGTVGDDVFKVTFARSDLKVRVGNVFIEPGLALTSWITFKQMGNKAMMMGDLVLLDKEVDSVLPELVSNGIEVTALHNHLVGESPSIMYMHFSGRGDPVKLAKAMKSALAKTKTPLSESKIGQPAVTGVDWSGVEAILGTSGKAAGSLLKYSFSRKEKIAENGMEIPPSMGVATPIGFQKVEGKAIVYGDFVLLAKEVNPVIKALVKHGITVTAVHNHMLFESPRLFFLHFWGIDKPEKLAKGVKAALDKTNSSKK